MDADLVVEVLVQIGVELRLKDIIQDAELAHLLGLEGLRVFEHFAVAVAEDIA